MRARVFASKLLTLGMGVLFLLSCLLPGMISLDPESSGPMPVMEKDGEALLETLQSGNVVRLQALAEEQYTEDDFAGPGTLTFTATVTNDLPIYFSYGWCTTTEEILMQNFEHIKIGLYFNGEQLEDDVVHPITFTRSDGLVCLEFGALMSDWSAGEHRLRVVAIFDEKINDGLADYEPGDYVFEYTVTVDE